MLNDQRRKVKRIEPQDGQEAVVRDYPFFVGVKNLLEAIHELF